MRGWRSTQGTWHIMGARGFGLDGQLTRKWSGGFRATVAYGGDEHFLTWTFALPHLLFFAMSLNTPFGWHRIRPRDGKYGTSQATFGVSSIGLWVRVMFGNDPMGTHYGYTRLRFGKLRRVWKNREVTVFHPAWIVGRDRHSKEVLDERLVEIAIDRWPGDRYQATQRIERHTWKNRFRTRRRTDVWWDVDRSSGGIPTDPHGKWGDEFGETTGFGAGLPEGLTLLEMLDAVPGVLEKRLADLLKDWPARLVPREVAP